MTASLTSYQCGAVLGNVCLTVGLVVACVVPSPKSQKYLRPLVFPPSFRLNEASNVTVFVVVGLAGSVSKYATGFEKRHGRAQDLGERRWLPRQRDLSLPGSPRRPDEAHRRPPRQAARFRSSVP
jgi:hypothetical protein